MSEGKSTKNEPNGEQSADAPSAEQLRNELAEAHREIERLRRLLAHPMLGEERAMVRDALDAALRGADLAAYRIRTYH
jgi:hypothetical protein